MDNNTNSNSTKQPVSFQNQDVIAISDEAKQIATAYYLAPKDVQKMIQTLLKLQTPDI